MPEESGRSDYTGQSEECGHQIEIGAGVSSIESEEEKDRVVEEKAREEMSDDRMVKKVFVENVPGRRPRGRPRKRWTGDLKVN